MNAARILRAIFAAILESYAVVGAAAGQGWQ
jgi:hypothetical protein